MWRGGGGLQWLEGNILKTEEGRKGKVFQWIGREDKLIGYRGKKDKEIITRCSCLVLIKRGREEKVFIRQVKKVKCYEER